MLFFSIHILCSNELKSIKIFNSCQSICWVDLSTQSCDFSVSEKDGVLQKLP